MNANKRKLKLFLVGIQANVFAYLDKAPILRLMLPPDHTQSVGLKANLQKMIPKFICVYSRDAHGCANAASAGSARAAHLRFLLIIQI